MPPFLDPLGLKQEHLKDKSTDTEAPAGSTDAHLSVNSVLFYRSTGWDVISLKHRAQFAGGKRVPMDCRKLIVSALSPHASTYCSEEVDQLAKSTPRSNYSCQKLVSTRREKRLNRQISGIPPKQCAALASLVTEINNTVYYGYLDL